MYQTPIFKAEREAGLDEKIRSSAAIAYASVVEPGPEFADLSREKVERLLKAKAFVQGHMNLHYLKTLLVSTGWNDNDDVFDRQEVWMARATPEDQPFNLEHDCSQIIGHITDNYAVGEEDKKLDEDITIDELPAQFHIVTGAVLYKHWDKAELQERMDDILKEIPEGKWYVSMEALFRGFDYAIEYPDGKTQSVIAREENSAFLTKHLRAYGGDGKYDGYRVGRLMRNICFSGKGLVRKPANKNSIILTATSAFVPNKKEKFQIQQTTGYLPARPISEESKVMATENDKNDEIQALKAELAKTKEANEKAFAEKISALETQLKSKSDEFATLTSQFADANKAKATAETSLAETNEKLAKIELAQKRTERISAIVQSLKVDEAKATKLHDAVYKSLADADFIEALKAQADYESEKMKDYQAKTPEPTVQTPAATKPTMGGKTGGKDALKTVFVNPAGARKSAPIAPSPYTATATEEEDPAAAAATAESLETAEVEKQAALSADSEHVDEEVEATRAEVHSFLGGYMKFGKPEKATKTE